MKNQAECYQALLDGETLISGDVQVTLSNGNQVAFDDEGNNMGIYKFICPENWSILKEPTYFYQWEKCYGETIALTDKFCTDEYAKEIKLIKLGWRKIESSKRTWKD